MPGVRTAVVTGGTGGIGAAIADALEAHGARVATLDRTEAPNNNSRKHFVGDVRDPAFVEKALESFLGAGGDLSLLVNCAGVMQRASFQDGSLEEMLDVLGINVSGTIICAKKALPYLRSGTGGSIVNIGSMWASHVWPGRSIYSASKAAVEQLTRCLAVDLSAINVRAYCISPGLVATQFTREVMKNPAFVESFMPRVPAGRAMEPEEVAQLVVAMADGDLGYAVGAPIQIHGGYY